MGHRRFRWKAIPGVLALSGCVASATAPSPTDPHGFTTTTISATASTEVDEGLASFRSCLGELGVVIDGIPLNAWGRPVMSRALASLDLSDGATVSAISQCAPHLAEGALDLSTDPELRRLVVETLEELARCVRAQGITGFPDPVPGFDGTGQPFPPGQIPWDDPRLAEAVTVCSPAGF